MLVMGCRLICEGGPFSPALSCFCGPWVAAGKVLSSVPFPCVWLQRGGGHHGCSPFSDYSSFRLQLSCCVCHLRSSVLISHTPFWMGWRQQFHSRVYVSHSGVFRSPTWSPASPGPINDAAVKCLGLNNCIQSFQRFLFPLLIPAQHWPFTVLDSVTFSPDMQ